MNLRPLAYAALTAASAVALAAAFFPAIAPLLQFDRLHPDIYRLLTAHLVHWTGQHLFWDLATFILLSLWLIPQSPARYLATLVLSALAITSAIAFLAPGLQTYRGLSGVDCALFALAGGLALGGAWNARSLAGIAGAGLALLALVAKTFYDLSGQPALFAGSMGADVVPVPLAHLVGIASGLMLALPSGLQRAVAPAATLSQTGATTRT